MRTIQLLFTGLGISVLLLLFSAYGWFTSDNSLYIMPVTLSSIAITFTLYCLYELKLPPEAKLKKDFYFYFIDNTPASRDLLNNHLGNRM